MGEWTERSAKQRARNSITELNLRIKNTSNLISESDEAESNLEKKS